MTDRPSTDLTRLQPILAEHDGQGRAALIPVLLEAQRAFGHLPEPVVEAIGQGLRVPLAEIHGVIEFYTMLYPQPVGRTMVRVCTSPICSALGGQAVLEAASRHLKHKPGEVTPDGAWTVEGVACLGLCDMAPAALVGNVPVARADALRAAAWIGAPDEAPLGRIGGEPRWLSGRCGQIEPTDVTAFVERGGFAGLRRALTELTPAQVLGEVKASGLVGRGGAACPTGT